MNKESILQAFKAADEKALCKYAGIVEDMLRFIRDVDHEDYIYYLRDFNEVAIGKHYDKEFAEMDVTKLRYTDASGVKKTGAHWTLEQIETATDGLPFPNGTTKWDKYVAYNAAYADFIKKFDDAQILDIAYLFYFADEDWKDGEKIWTYMSMNK